MASSQPGGQDSAGATVYKQGRPAWYDATGEVKTGAFVIGIAGGSASGKTTVAKRIIDEINVPWVALLSQDSFYKVLNEEEIKAAHNNDFDFDAPDAIDMELLCETIKKLKEGERVKVPVYDFTTHSRSDKSEWMYGASVVVFEGLFALCEPVRDLLDLKVFVDEADDTRLARRLERDIAERGREMEGCLKQYSRFVKPSFEKYIKPTMRDANVIVPHGSDNVIAMSLLIEHVRKQLSDRGQGIRKNISKDTVTGTPPAKLNIMPETNQIRGIHTIIRNRDTDREDFVFYSERLMRLLMEFANGFLPHAPVEVETACGRVFAGQRLSKPVVGVSILRSGLAMESSLRSVHRGARLGKILIQTNPASGEPELHYCKLPDVQNHAIIVMEPTIATGAAAMMAIRVLLDHGAKQEDIIVTCLVAANIGVHALANAFPNVRLIVSAIDEELSESYEVLPGLGNFGSRYFGAEGKKSPKAAVPV